MHPLAALQFGDEKGKIFVGGLSWDTTVESLLRYFSRYGEVIDCVVMKNPQTGKSRGFGFVTFRDTSCVQTVLASGPHTLDGRVVDPKACNPRSMNKGGKNAEVRNKKVFVGGLPTNCTEAQLEESFQQYGKVQEVAIMFDQQKQRSRGFGFVTFEAEESVDRVCQQHYVHISGKQVEVKRAEPRDALVKPTEANQMPTSGTPIPTVALPTAALQGMTLPAGWPPSSQVAGNGVGVATLGNSWAQTLPQGAGELGAAWTPPATYASTLQSALYSTTANQGGIQAVYASGYPVPTATPTPTLTPITQAATTTQASNGSPPVQSTSTTPIAHAHATGDAGQDKSYQVPVGVFGTYSQEASSYGPARAFIQPQQQPDAAGNGHVPVPYSAANVAYAAGPSLIAGRMGTYTAELNATYLGLAAGYGGQGDGLLHTPYAPHPATASYGRILASHLVATPSFHPYRR